MITETIVLDNNDNSWRSIVNTGTSITIAAMSHPIRVRFGISSVSDGIPLDVNDVLTAEETIYVQPVNVKSSIQTRSGKKYGNTVTIYVNKG